MENQVLTPVSPPPLRKAPVCGVISTSMGVACMAAAGFVGYRAFAGDRDYDAIATLSFIGLVASLVGLAFACAGLVIRPKESRGWLIGGISVCALAVLCQVTVTMAAKVMETARKDRIDSTEPIVVAPIEWPEDSYTSLEFREQWRAWLLKHAVEPSKAQFAGKPAEQATAEIFDAYVEFWLNSPERPSRQEWNRLSTRLLDVPAHGSPTCQLLSAGRSDRPVNVLGMNSPIQAFRKSEKNPFWRLVVELQNMEMANRTSSSERSMRSQDEAILALEDMLEAGWFEGDDIRLLADLTEASHFPDLFKAKADVILEIMEEQELPAWILHLVRGKKAIDDAWKARGGGYSNTVTDEGWDKFHSHLATARTELEAAWELAPQYPFAASEMIAVSMGSSDDPETEMREWFDRAIAAQCDFWPAYKAWRWGMRPRWHGTREAMLDFGEECLATYRFDTNVPAHYLWTLEDLDSDGWDDIYRESGVYDQLRTLSLGYINEDLSPEETTYWRTTLAVHAYRNSQYHDLKEQWTALEGAPNPLAMTYWHADREGMEFRAVIGYGSPRVQAALNLQGDGKRDKAIGAFRKEAAAAEADPPVSAALARRADLLELDRAYATGEWVELVPTRNSLWRSAEGSFTIADDGAIVATSDSTRYSIWHPLKLGRDFEVEFDIETREKMLNYSGPGIHLSYRPFESSNWNTFHILQRHNGDRYFEMANARYAHDLSVQAPHTDRIRMRLICHEEKWEGFADDKPIHRGIVTMQNEWISSNTRLALAGWSTNPSSAYSQRYFRVRVRKLAPLTEGNP